MNPSADDRQLREARRRDFEQQIVTKILYHAGVVYMLRDLKTDCSEVTGSPQLTLDWFHDRFPDFPVRLGAVAIPKLEIEWTDVFQRFTATRFFQAYRDWRSGRGHDDRREHVGIVFNTTGLTFVLHNHPSHPTGRTCRVVRSLGDPPVRFVLELFESMLESVCEDCSWCVYG